MKKALVAAALTASMLVPATAASAATPAAAQPHTVATVTAATPSPMIFGGQGQCTRGGRLVGQFLAQIHHGVEGLILGLGLRPITEPIDRTFVHPLLWDPIEKVTCTKIDDPVMLNGQPQ